MTTCRRAVRLRRKWFYCCLASGVPPTSGPVWRPAEVLTVTWVAMEDAFADISWRDPTGGPELVEISDVIAKSGILQISKYDDFDIRISNKTKLGFLNSYRDERWLCFTSVEAHGKGCSRQASAYMEQSPFIDTFMIFCGYGWLW